MPSTCSPKPVLYDLFSGAGGAARGYQLAGFEVWGVDVKPQPRYCGNRFFQMDAFAFVEAVRAGEYPMPAAWHASPPCQGYSVMRHAPGAVGAPRLIAATRGALIRSGRPWVIENVEGARSEMRNPITLCGSMFGLGAEGCWLQRHRLFEASFLVEQPPCAHGDGPVIGVYGGHARRRAARHGGRTTRDVWTDGHRQAAATAMGMGWATLSEMSEAVPPAYTEWIGGHLMRAVIEEARHAAV